MITIILEMKKKEDMGKKYDPSNLLFLRYKFIESKKQNENKKTNKITSRRNYY